MVHPRAAYDDGNLDPSDTTAYFVCNIILLVIGVCSNLLLILSILTFKKLRTIENAFVVNLAVADSLSIVLLDVLSVIGEFVDNGNSPLEDDSRVCKAVAFFCISTCICSVWSVAACALYIYVRVCHKALYEVLYTPQVVIVMIFWLWTLCPMIVLPSVMGWGSFGFDSRLMHCTYDSSASGSFTYFMLTLGAWTPLTLTLYLLGKSIIVLRKQTTNVDPYMPNTLVVTTVELDSPPSRSPSPNTTLRSETNTMRSVMFVALYMVIAWITMSVVWILGQRTQIGDVQFMFGMILAHSPCSINGIIYALTNEDFREAYMKVFTFWRRCRKNGNTEGDNKEGVTTHPGTIISGRETSLLKQL